MWIWNTQSVLGIGEYSKRRRNKSHRAILARCTRFWNLQQPISIIKLNNTYVSFEVPNPDLNCLVIIYLQTSRYFTRRSRQNGNWRSRSSRNGLGHQRRRQKEIWSEESGFFCLFYCHLNAYWWNVFFSGMLSPCGPGTSLWITAPFAATILWTCVGFLIPIIQSTEYM